MQRAYASVLTVAALLAIPVTAAAAGPPAGWSRAGPSVGLDVRSIAVDPEQPLHAVAVAASMPDEPPATRLYETVDGGVSWQAGPATVDGQDVDYATVVIAGGSIWVLSSLGRPCFAPSIAGSFACPATAGLPGSLAAVPGMPGTLVSVERNVLRRSTDGGATWAEVARTTPLPEDIVVADPTTPGALYGPRGSRTTRSTDGGLTWILGGPSDGSCASVRGLAADPSTAGRLYVQDGTAVCRSTDAGATWQRTASLPAGDAVGSILAVTGEGVLLVSTADGALRRSADAGAGWTTATGLVGRRVMAVAPAGARTYVAASLGPFVSVDGGATFRQAAAGMGARAVSGPKVFQTGTNVVYALQGHELLRSADGGATWDVRSAGPGALFGVDPRSGALYASSDTSGSSLARSADGGATFEPLSSDPDLAELYPPFVISPADPNVMYVSNVDGALIASRDGGRTWEQMPLRGSTVLDYAADAGDPRRLYGVLRPPRGVGAALAVSADGGRTWQRRGRAAAAADEYQLLAHPTRPGVVVALDKTTLYVSRDGGRTFRPQPLGFFMKLYRNIVGFQGAFVGDTLVVAGSWGPERKLGVAREIQRGGGLLASPDLGRSWTWYPTSLQATVIQQLAAGEGQVLVTQRAVTSGNAPAGADATALWRAPAPRVATSVRSPKVVIVQARRRSLRCVAGAFAAQTSPTTTIGTDRNPGVLGLPPFQLRRAGSLAYGYACRTIARTPEGIAHATSPAKRVPPRG